MTPSRIRDALALIQAQVRDLEERIEAQNSANPVYQPLCHELTESWDALERAAALADEVGVGN
jgi:hypothetical protein